jgi:hypothetical protein
MQYKIPVQIENEDPIILWLGLKQLTIIIIWWWIWYNVFKALVNSVWPEIAAIPSIIIIVIAIAIAKFRIAWMTFLNFIYSFIRFKVNLEERKWMKWVDSFQPIDLWFITNIEDKKGETIDMESKIDKLNKLKDNINNI